MTGKPLKVDYDVDAEIAALNENFIKDFGLTALELQKENLEKQKKLNEQISAGTAKPASEEKTPEKPVKTEVEAKDFEGIAEKVGETVFGQEKFIKKMLVAFRRPFVLPEEKGHARNSFFLTGKEDTGKHTALRGMTKELAARNLIASPEIKVIDLALYTQTGRDNVFLQDLYEALSSKAQVLLFEHFEACHISYLAYVSELVISGECRLAERYTLQKGQLVGVSNAFSSEAVGTFSAAGKYLVFISTKGLTALANSLGAPFINALGDIAETEEMDEESYRKISLVELKKLKHEVEERLKFELSGETAPIVEAGVRASDRGKGVTGILDFYKKLLKAFAAIRLEQDVPYGAKAELCSENGRVVAKIGEKSIDLLDLLPGGYHGELDDVKKEMDNIVGLQKIKDYIFSLEEYYNVQKRRREQGLKSGEVSKHMIFTGNPGTGKTTIARIISRYLKAIGVLSGGQLVEVTRADLVGRYVGHTAPLTNQVLKSAIGGVLFIDEAYSLYRGKDDSFGLEAIDTLVKGIEDNRDNLIVILAGYSKEMAEFLTSNSGLESRFPNVIEFPDYTGEELTEIAKITAKSKGYRIDPDTEIVLLTYFNAVQALRAATAGNGRLVRNKVEEAILNHSRRLVAEPDADLSLLTSRDFSLDDVAG
ncbi:MAG: AAA family ATPase [Lachnospiraceae bacterium]|nr:AAA family ATPase [Lachnospiraceae bacterium]